MTGYYAKIISPLLTSFLVGACYAYAPIALINGDLKGAVVLFVAALFFAVVTVVTQFQLARIAYDVGYRDGKKK